MVVRPRGHTNVKYRAHLDLNCIYISHKWQTKIDYVPVICRHLPQEASEIEYCYL